MYKFTLGIVLIVVLLLGAIFSSVAYATPLSQDPRPPRDSGGGGGGDGGGDTGDGGTGGGPSDLKCASLVGQAFQWGVGGIGGVTTELKTGSWQISTISATDGNYGFGGLGVGAATLHVALAPEQVQQLQPLIQDAGVYLNCDFPIVANIALFSGDAIKPPVTIAMSASRTAIKPGQKVDITLTINNGLPTGISNVVVTDLFPPGLTPVNVSTAAGPDAAKVVSANEAGQLVVVNLDKMAAGAKATIRLTVMAGAELPAGTFSNTATLFYRESAAHQASLEFTVAEGAQPTSTPVPSPITDTTTTPTPLPGILETPTVITVSEPVAETVLSPTVVSIVPPPTVIVTPTAVDETESGEGFVPPGGLPTTGDNFVPPPSLLPVTGQDTVQIPNQLPNTGLGLILPVSGLGLAGLAFILHRLRISRQNRLRVLRQNRLRALPRNRLRILRRNKK